jgi:hypothetical protein
MDQPDRLLSALLNRASIQRATKLRLNQMFREFLQF